MKSSSTADTKSPYWSVPILAALVEITRPSLLRPDLFCKQSSPNLAIFGRNEDDFREKTYVSLIPTPTFSPFKYLPTLQGQLTIHPRLTGHILPPSWAARAPAVLALGGDTVSEAASENKLVRVSRYEREKVRKGELCVFSLRGALLQDEPSFRALLPSWASTWQPGPR